MPFTNQNYFIMTEREKARENELMEFANKCKEAGLRVFFDEWEHYFGRKSYFHASDGIGIAYVENSSTYFGLFSLSLTYKGSKNFGSGCQIISPDEWGEPKVENVIAVCKMRSAPAWLTERENRYLRPGQKPIEPEFYKDVDEWLRAKRRFVEVVEL